MEETPTFCDGATQSITSYPDIIDADTPDARYYSGTFLYNPPAFDALPKVVINRDTGKVVLRNGTDSALDIVGYSITSDNGALNMDNWTSITDNYDKNGPPPQFDSDDAWTRLTTGSGAKQDLSEFQFFDPVGGPGDGGTLGSGEELDLGNDVWIANPDEESDIHFTYVLQNGTAPEQGIVQFEGGIGGDSPWAFGDLNFDGAAFQLDDFTDVLLPQLESSHTSLSVAQTYQFGDLNGDLLVDEVDFRIFKDAYLSGGGSLAALSGAIAGVPEPSACWLALLGLVGVVFTQRTALRSFRGVAVLAALVCLVTAARSASAQIVALESVPPLVGNQANFDGTLGMDFDVVEFPIQVSALGVFDSNQDGIKAQDVFAEIWSRNNGGTPNDPNDDTGGAVVVGPTTFSPGDDGTLLGGSRFKSVTPVTLNPGSYTISAGNFNGDDSEVNLGYSGPAPTIHDGGGLLKFVGASRVGNENTAGTFPIFNGGGPETRFHAGTFQYSLAVDPMKLEVNRATGTVTIHNTSSTSTTYDIDYYRISSDMHSLDPGWAGISGWSNGGAVDDTLLVEANLTGSTVFTPGMSVSLGHAYDTAADKQDLTFTYYTPSGVGVEGTVQYVSSIPGDYDGSGTVDNLDYTKWKSTFGSTSDLAADGNGNNVVDAGDYTIWRDNLGATSSGAGSVASAPVPEPGAGALLFILLAAIVGLWRTGRSSGLRFERIAAYARATVAAAVALALLAASTALASSTLDRDYRLGDDSSEDASNGIEAGTGATNPEPGYTFDSEGTVGAGDLQDLEVFGTTGGLPKYVSIAGRPDGGGGLGIQFDGVDDYLQAYRLGLPSTSEAAADGVDGKAPLDYAGLINRGFQLWVKPDRNDVQQSIVMDTSQHGLEITSEGTWGMLYVGGTFDSGVTATPGEWAHLMVVRPYGATPGSLLYVNGIAVAAAPGGYFGGEDEPLVLGANTDSANDEGDAGTKDFFDGTLDDLEMFVLGTTTSPAHINYGTFNAGEDNAIIAAAVAGFDLGDVNLDHNVNSADVDEFVTDWQYERVVMGQRVGDLTSRQNGDLNYDGIVDLSDAILLNQRLLANGSGALDFSKLHGAAVPEPSTWVLIVSGAALLWRRSFRTH